MLLSSDCRDTDYVSPKLEKPILNKVNILGNLKKHQMTRALSSCGGPSWRPAIVSATGGEFTQKPKGVGIVNDDNTIELYDQSPEKVLRRPKSQYRESKKTKVIAKSSK